MNKDFISIAGSRRGADTAVVVKHAHQDLFSTYIRKIIAKPNIVKMARSYFSSFFTNYSK
jgi:hypothetical protein